jgi:hypothetical protein
LIHNGIRRLLYKLIILVLLKNYLVFLIYKKKYFNHNSFITCNLMKSLKIQVA